MSDAGDYYLRKAAERRLALVEWTKAREAHRVALAESAAVGKAIERTYKVLKLAEDALERASYVGD